MQTFVSQEQLVYFMRTGSINVSRQDHKFLFNIQTCILQKKPITTNQITLYKKILLKYKRQFLKQGINVEDLFDLPWDTEIILSNREFTEPKIEIINNRIYFYVPYNIKFLKYFRKQENNEQFSWSKDFHRYIADFNTRNIKLAIQSASKFYENVSYCVQTQEILNTINSFDGIKYWNPTLINKNGLYLIAATNQSLDNVLKEIELNDNNRTLSLLAEHGVSISDEIISSDEKRFFAEYYASVDYGDIDFLIKYLVELECDGVIISEASFSFLSNRKELHYKLKSANIPLITTHMHSDESIITELKRPVRVFLFNYESTNCTQGVIKIITLTTKK